MNIDEISSHPHKLGRYYSLDDTIDTPELSNYVYSNLIFPMLKSFINSLSLKIHASAKCGRNDWIFKN